MNTPFKKVAMASALITGLAGSLVLQAHENADTTNQGPATEGRGSMPMDMHDMKGMMQMMGSSEHMAEMMTACAKMMQAHTRAEPESKDNGTQR